MYSSPLQNVLILGDLNAGCSYITIKGWRALPLRSDPRFHWLIGDEQDTTVRQKTHCAYDRSEKVCSGVGCSLRKKQYLLLLPNRIIVHGREIVSCIVPGSAQPFNFKETFHLSEEEVNVSGRQ